MFVSYCEYRKAPAASSTAFEAPDAYYKYVSCHFCLKSKTPRHFVKLVIILTYLVR